MYYSSWLRSQGGTDVEQQLGRECRRLRSSTAAGRGVTAIIVLHVEAFVPCFTAACRVIEAVMM